MISPIICFLVGTYLGQYIPPLYKLTKRVIGRRVYRTSQGVILPPPMNEFHLPGVRV